MPLHEFSHRTDEEIDRVLNWAFEGREKGTRFAHNSYEDGLIAMLDWLTGIEDQAPDEEKYA